MELYLIRHAESLWNAEKRIQGHRDVDLNEHGLKQAQALAGRLSSAGLSALYSSDLLRARRTAEAIARQTRLEVQSDAALRERNLGIFEGLTFDEVAQNFAGDARRHHSGDPDYVIPKGESYRQSYERVLAALDRIRSRHSQGRVAVVAHGGALDALFRHVTGLPLTSKRCARLLNASINVFLFEKERALLQSWGDVAHLEGIGSQDRW